MKKINLLKIFSAFLVPLCIAFIFAPVAQGANTVTVSPAIHSQLTLRLLNPFNPNKETIIFIHGFGVDMDSRNTFAYLISRLQSGYNILYVNYSADLTLDSLAQALNNQYGYFRRSSYPGYSKGAAFIAHSYGNLILRKAILNDSTGLYQKDIFIELAPALGGSAKAIRGEFWIETVPTYEPVGMLAGFLSKCIIEWWWDTYRLGKNTAVTLDPVGSTMTGGFWSPENNIQLREKIPGNFILLAKDDEHNPPQDSSGYPWYRDLMLITEGMHSKFAGNFQRALIDSDYHEIIDTGSAEDAHSRILSIDLVYQRICGFLNYFGRPSAPSDLKVIPKTNSILTLMWKDNSPNENGFKIERSFNNRDFITVTVGSPGIGFNILTKDLGWSSPGVVSYYRVSAFNSYGDSEYSKTVEVRPGPVPKPTNLACIPYPNYILLKWQEASDNAAGYDISIRRPNGNVSYRVGVNSYVDRYILIPNSGSYSFCVRAVNGAGTLGYTGWVYAASPVNAPRNLAAKAVLNGGSNGVNRIELSWDYAPCNEYGFRITRLGSDGTTRNFNIFSDEKLFYGDEDNIRVGVTYTYSVRAENSLGLSGESNRFPVRIENNIPAAPASLTLTKNASPIGYRLTWQDRSNNEDGFMIERGPTSDDKDFVPIDMALAGVNNYLDTDAAGKNYFYRVCAVNEAGASAYSNVVSSPILPSNLTATAVSSTQINLRWDCPGNVPGFKILRSIGGSGPWSQIAQLGAGVRSYSNTGLSAGTLYYYRVMRQDASGNADYSEASATTIAALLAPVNLIANGGANAVYLNWTNRSNDITGILVYRSTQINGTYSYIAYLSGAPNSYTDAYQVLPNTTYYYKIRATKSGVGQSDFSNIASAITQTINPPVAPTGLVIGLVSHNQINLNWMDNSSDETGFRVERSTNSSFTANLTIINKPQGSTNHGDTGLTANTAYYYRVKAIKGALGSGYSNIVNATTSLPLPIAPAALTATVNSSTQINLSWVDNSNNETGFKIERKIGSNGSWSQIAQHTSVIYPNTGLTPGTTYYYRVRAYNLAGNSAYSNESYATTTQVPPAAPSGLSASIISATQVNLNWVDNSTNEAGFKIERKIAGGSWSQIAATTSNSYANTGLTPGTIYYYQVRAYNSAGNSAYSPYVIAATPQQPTNIPAAPTNLIATAASATQINLAWQVNSNNETGFAIERKIGPGGAWGFFTTVGPGAGYFSNGNLAEGTTYTYRVRAFNASGDSAWSNEASATTLSRPPAVLAAPSSLRIANISSSQATLSWRDNSGNETSFYIERSNYSDFRSKFTYIVSANKTSYVCAGLGQGATYYFRVRAYNNKGYSGYSNAVSATAPRTAATTPNRGLRR